MTQVSNAQAPSSDGPSAGADSDEALAEADETVAAPRQRRPRRGSQERRRAILEAATQLFMEHGFRGASIDQIIEQVGGSKQTIYTTFGSKRDLFIAMIRANVAEFMSGSETLETTGDIEDILWRFGRLYYDVMRAPRPQAIFRIVIHEGHHFPELAEAFYALAPSYQAQRLAEILAEHRDHGAISVPDTYAAANQFFGMLRDDLVLACLIGIQDPPTPETSDERVRQAVDIFLNGVRTR